MVARNDYQKLLDTVSTWPVEDRITFVREVLDSVRGREPNTKRPSFEGALGIARGNSPAPSDAEVDHWIHEHRMRKYGS
jgi:hypothetical protein